MQTGGVWQVDAFSYFHSFVSNGSVVVLDVACVTSHNLVHGASLDSLRRPAFACQEVVGESAERDCATLPLLGSAGLNV